MRSEIQPLQKVPNPILRIVAVSYAAVTIANRARDIQMTFIHVIDYRNWLWPKIRPTDPDRT